MTAQEVYNVVDAYAPSVLLTACEFNKRCRANRQCVSPQSVLMVDFDSVKTKWNSSQGQSSMSSVDGLTCNNGVLCFVEIKSTVDFVKFQIKPHKTDTQNREKINKQMKSYTTSLQKKFVESITICQGITGNPKFPDGVNIRYVLVTDVNLNPLANLATQLSQLAAGSSNWDVIYASILGSTFNQSTAKLSGVTTDYKSCQELDDYIRGLV